MSRKLITVATKDCEKGLRQMVASAFAKGWDKEIIVNTPDQEWQPDIEGVKMRHRFAWYLPSKEVRSCRNAPALIKPSAFLGNHPADLILYVDGSDVLFMENPHRLFDLFEESGAMLAARPFRDNRKVGHDDEIIQNMIGPKLTRKRDNYCNSGVIMAKMCPLVEMAMLQWKYLLGYVHFAGPWKIGGPNNKLVGDQEAFNVVYRTIKHCSGEESCFDLDSSWNYRGSSRIKSNLHVIENRVFDEHGKEVFLVHCSGLGEMPEQIIKASLNKGEKIQR